MYNLYLFKATFSSVMEDNTDYVVAPSIRSAITALESKYGIKLLDRILLKVEFVKKV